MQIECLVEAAVEASAEGALDVAVVPCVDDVVEHPAKGCKCLCMHANAQAKQYERCRGFRKCAGLRRRGESKVEGVLNAFELSATG